MKLIKEELIKAGIDEKVADEIITELGNSYVTKESVQSDYISKEDVSKSYIDKKSHDSIVTANNDKVNEYENFVKKAMELVGADEKEKVSDCLDTLKANIKQKEKDHKAEIQQIKLDNAVQLACTSNKARNIKAVMALLDTSKVTLGDDGKVYGLDEQFTTIKASDPYLFETEKGTNGIKGADAGNGGTGGEDKPDFSKMSYDELVKYTKENPGVTLE